MSAFDWLSDVFNYILSLIPHVTIIKKTHGGVAFVRGKHVKELKPGLVIWWPFWTELMEIPVVRQSLDMPPQTLTTKDGKPVTIAGVTIYRVADPVTALTIQWDLEETVRDLSGAAIRSFVCDHTFEELRTNRAHMDRRLTKAVAEALEEYGIEVINAWLTDLAETRVLTIVTPAGGAQYVVEDEE